MHILNKCSKKSPERQATVHLEYHRENVPYLATDSCRDGWNVRDYSSNHVQVFRDGWNVRNCLNMIFLNLVKIWIWILQNLRCLGCKSKNFVLVVKPTLMSLFWLFGLLFAMYDWSNWVAYVVVVVWISLILGCLRCAWYTSNFSWYKP